MYVYEFVYSSFGECFLHDDNMLLNHERRQKFGSLHEFMGMKLR